MFGLLCAVPCAREERPTLRFAGSLHSLTHFVSDLASHTKFDLSCLRALVLVLGLAGGASGAVVGRHEGLPPHVQAGVKHSEFAVGSQLSHIRAPHSLALPSTEKSI